MPRTPSRSNVKFGHRHGTNEPSSRSPSSSPQHRTKVPGPSILSRRKSHKKTSSPSHSDPTPEPHPTLGSIANLSTTFSRTRSHESALSTQKKGIAASQADEGQENLFTQHLPIGEIFPVSPQLAAVPISPKPSPTRRDLPSQPPSPMVQALHKPHFIPYITPAYLPGGAYPYHHESPYWPGSFVPQHMFDFADMNEALPTAHLSVMPIVHAELSYAPLRWHILSEPLSAVSVHRGYISQEEYACPGAEVMVLHFQHVNPRLHSWLSLFGPIVVHKQLHPEITITDVLHAISSFFLRPLKKDEYDRLPLMDRNMVFASRFKRAGSDASRCGDAHLLRVDMLDGHMEFAGLRFLAVDGNQQVDVVLDLMVNQSWISWPSV